MANNILAVDAGNTRVNFGIFDRTDGEVQPVAFSAVVVRRRCDVAKQIAGWAQQYDVGRSIVAGSNPPVLDRLIAEWPPQLPVAKAIRTTRAIPVTLSVDQPDAVGLDRVLNTLAAAWLYPGQNVVVIDSGTATTVDLVSSDGNFCGGTIFPGLRLSAHALHDYTAKLPMIDVDTQQSVSPRLPGKNTEEAIRSGLLWGQLGAINEIVDRIGQTLSVRPVVILTGGGSQLLRPHLTQSNWVEALALHGLAMLAEQD